MGSDGTGRQPGGAGEPEPNRGSIFSKLDVCWTAVSIKVC
jgi:hypothetical protein